MNLYIISGRCPRTHTRTHLVTVKGNTLNNIHEESFPFIKYKPNKNKYSINPWFTSALLVSRKQKEKLFKKKILNPTKNNLQ